MARLRVIILEQPDPQIYRYALWADVPAEEQTAQARPGARSVWALATDEDHAAIASGAMLERTDQLVVVPGTPIDKVQQQLEGLWATFQAEWSVAQRAAMVWDGASWSSAVRVPAA